MIEHETRPITVDDEKIGRVWTFRDITARVRAFTLLHESEQRFRVFADSAAYGIVMHQDGEVVYANEAAGRELGYDVEEMIGLRVIDFIPEDDRPAMRERAVARA